MNEMQIAMKAVEAASAAMESFERSIGTHVSPDVLEGSWGYLASDQAERLPVDREIVKLAQEIILRSVAGRSSDGK